MSDGTRRCGDCAADLPIERFDVRANGRRRPYCNACRRKRNGTALSLRTCGYCGATFRPKQSTFSTYCTRECGWQGQAKTRADAHWLGKFSPLPWKQCLQCGAEFYARGAARLCSDACRNSRGYQKRIGTVKPAVCVECGVGFTFTVTRGHPITTCSAQCKERRSAQNHAASSAKGKAMRAARLESQPSELVRPIEIYLRDGWRCQICGGQVDKRSKVPHPKAPTMDHIIPVSLGGPHTRQNLRLAHFLCNSKRGNRESAQLHLIG